MNFELNELLNISKNGFQYSSRNERKEVFEYIENINEQKGRLKMLAALQNAFIHFSEKHNKSTRKFFRKIIYKIEIIARELGSVSATMRWLEYKKRYINWEY